MTTRTHDCITLRSYQTVRIGTPSDVEFTFDLPEGLLPKQFTVLIATIGMLVLDIDGAEEDAYSYGHHMRVCTGCCAVTESYPFAQKTGRLVVRGHYTGFAPQPFKPGYKYGLFATVVARVEPRRPARDETPDEVYARGRADGLAAGRAAFDALNGRIDALRDKLPKRAQDTYQGEWFDEIDAISVALTRPEQ
jgi:hypothetical protein